MRSKRLYVQNRLTAQELRDGIVSRNTRMGRVQAEICLRLREHVGEACSVVQEKLINDISQLEILQIICWSEVMKTEQLTQGSEAHPLLTVYLQAQKQKASLLKMIGLKRVPKEKGLAEVLRGGGKDV